MKKNESFLHVICPGCHTERNVRPSDWRRRKTDFCKSCSIRARVGLEPNNAPTGKGTALYTAWRGLRQRCGHIAGAHEHDKRNYADRGIDVCDAWRLSFAPFKEWALTHGYRPGLILDRINNNRGYWPDNCRWVTVLESNRNKRSVFDRATVEWIREAALFGTKQRDLAHAYDVSEATISNIVNRVTWQ
jgi:hypothetical protein